MYKTWKLQRARWMRRPDRGGARPGETFAAIGARWAFLFLFLGCWLTCRAADEPPPPAPPTPAADTEIFDALLAGEPAPAAEPTPAPPPPPPPEPAPAPVNGGFAPYRMHPSGEFHLLDDGAIVVLSNARERAGFQSDRIRVTCDGAVFHPRKGYLFAEGHVTVVEGLTRISCSRFFYDLAASRGWAEEVEIAGLERLAPGVVPGDRRDADSPYISQQAAREGLTEFSAALQPDAGLLPPREDNPDETRMLMLRTDKLWRLDETHFRADQASVTSSEMPDPEWSLGLKQVRYEQYPPGEDGRARGRVVGDQVVAQLFGLPLMWSPWGSYPVGLKGPFVAGEAGESQRWGTYGNLRLGYDTSDLRRDRADDFWVYLLPRRSYLDLTPRTDRGMGGGVSLRWEGSKAYPYDRLSVRADGVEESRISRPEDADRAQRFLELRSTSRLQFLPRSVKDSMLADFQRYQTFWTPAPTADPTLHLYRNDLRHGVYGDLHLERQPTAELRWVGDVAFTDVHDPQYYEEYNPEQFRVFRSERIDSYDPSRWQTAPRAVNQATVRGFWRDVALEGRWETPAERFQVTAPSFDPLGFHQPAYEPEARVFLAPLPLWAGFLVEGEGRAGRVGQRWDPFLLNTASYQADRYGARMLLSRPFVFGGFSIRPRIGLQATHYSRFELGPEPDIDQAAFLAGVELVDRWVGRSDFAFKPLGLDGFDHIIELFADYDMIGRPTAEAINLPGIDPWDDLAEVQVIRVGIRQSFLNRNPRGREDFARRYGRLELSLEGYPDPVDANRLLYHGSFDSLIGSFQWRPRSFFQIDGWARWWTYDGFLERTSLAVSYLPVRGMRLVAREMHTDHDPERLHERQDTLYLDAEWDISRRWRLGYGMTYEFFDTSLVRRGLRYQHFSLTRDFGSMELGGFLVVNPGRDETHGLVSVKVKASRAQAWPARDNRRVTQEMLERDAQTRAERAAAEREAVAANDRLTGGEPRWMEREEPAAPSAAHAEKKESDVANPESPPDH